LNSDVVHRPRANSTDERIRTIYAVYLDILAHYKQVLTTRELQTKLSKAEVEKYVGILICYMRRIIKNLLETGYPEEALCVDYLSKVVLIAYEDLFAAYVLNKELLTKNTQKRVNASVDGVRGQIAKLKEELKQREAQHKANLISLEQQVKDSIAEKSRLESMLRERDNIIYSLEHRFVVPLDEQ
jgi:hypothetical protein